MDPQEFPNPPDEPSMAEILRDLVRRMERLERRYQRSTSSRHEPNRGRDDTSSSYRPRQSHVKKLDTYHVLVATPEETIVAVEKEQCPIWDEEPIQEPPLHEEELLFSNEHDEPTIELIGGPRFDPEYEDQQEEKDDDAKTKPIEKEFDIIPSMVLPTEPQNEPALILKTIPTIMKTPLPPRENDRVVKPKTGPWMGRLGVQGGPAHLGPTYAKTGPPRAELRGRSGFLYGNPWDPGIKLRRVIALLIRRAIEGI